MSPITNAYALPLSSFELPWYDFTMVLDGTRYTFTMRYNSRIDSWMFDIADAQENPLVSGIALLSSRLLTEQYKTLDIPTGYFFVVDNTGAESNPSLQSFVLGTHTLYYGSIS